MIFSSPISTTTNFEDGGWDALKYLCPSKIHVKTQTLNVIISVDVAFGHY
jgi:hypothetical protein